MTNTYDPEAEVPTPAVPRTLVRASAPLPAFGQERSFGFGGGYGPGGTGPTAPEKASLERAATIKANDVALGAPTSYGGGVRGTQPEIPAADLSTAGGGFNPERPSFSNPVQVIRRLASTYTGPGPGEEHKTLAEANQAFNREAGVGEYVPPGGELQTLKNEAEIKKAEIMATREPPQIANLRTLQTKGLEQEQATKTGDANATTLKNYLLNAHGGLENNQLVFKPADEGMVRDAKAAEEVARRTGEGGGPAAITHFQERQAVRSYLNKIPPEQLPQNFDVNAYIGAVSQNPEAWKELVTKGRAQRVTAPTQPGAMADLGKIGEALTPEWMKPKPGVNY